MAGGYQVGIASETKAFKQGVESGIIEPLEDAQKELLELGRNRGPEQLERALKDAEDATDRLGDETKRTARSIEDDFRDTYRKVKDAAEDGTDGAREGMDDLKSEAKQSARETAASFGEVEDALDLVQEVAANAFGGFGPAGEAAGLAAAVGLGLVFAEFERQKEAADELKQRLSGLYQEALESGRDYIDQSQFIAESNDLRFNTDRADEWKRLQEDAKRLATDENTLIKANAGDLAAIDEVQRRINEAKEDGSAYYTTEREGLQQLKPEYRDMEERWKSLKSLAEQNADAVRAAQSSEDAFWREVLSGADSATVAVDDFGNKLLELPDGRQVVIDAKTGKATSDVSKFKKDTDGVIRSLNGKDIVLEARASVAAAQRDIDRLISRNNGRELYFKGRVITPAGSWD